MEEVYPGVNTVILDEDAQGIEEPIIKPMKPKKFSALLSEKGMHGGTVVKVGLFYVCVCAREGERDFKALPFIELSRCCCSFHHVLPDLPQTKYTPEFMATLMEAPHLIRHVAVVGALHHGKTSLLDLLIQQTHEKPWDPTKEHRYTDTRKDEQER